MMAKMTDKMMIQAMEGVKQTWVKHMNALPWMYVSIYVTPMPFYNKVYEIDLIMKLTC